MFAQIKVGPPHLSMLKQGCRQRGVGGGKQQPTAGADTAASAVTHAPAIRPINWALACAVGLRGRSISSERETDSALGVVSDSALRMH